MAGFQGGVGWLFPLMFRKTFSSLNILSFCQIRRLILKSCGTQFSKQSRFLQTLDQALSEEVIFGGHQAGIPTHKNGTDAEVTLG